MANIERTGSARILEGTTGTLQITVLVDNAGQDPDAALCSVVDEQGNAIAVTVAIDAGLNGIVFATLNDPAELGRLTATWTITLDGYADDQTFVTYHEVVGDILFAVAELRAFDGGAVASTSTYTSKSILAMRDLVAEAFEQVTGVAFGARFKREIFDGSGDNTLWLNSMQVGSVLGAAIRTAGTTTWVALTAGELADLLVSPNGRVIRDSMGSWTSGKRNIRVDYTYGYQPIPFEVKRAAMWVARNYLTGTNLPRNAISQVDELGTFQLSIPGRPGSWFGLPEVDRVLRDYRDRNRIPAVG